MGIQSPVEVAQAEQRLLNKPDFARELGKKGRERVLQETIWDRAASKILNKMVDNF